MASLTTAHRSRLALAGLGVLLLAGCGAPAGPGSAPVGGVDTGIHKICEGYGVEGTHDVTVEEFVAATGIEVAGTPDCLAFTGMSYELETYVVAYATDDTGLVDAWYENALAAGWTGDTPPASSATGVYADLHVGDGGNGGGLQLIYTPDYAADRPGQGITGSGLAVTITVLPR